ncbi:MAG: hypothetical protein HEQ35_30885 [Gloeotrichia echinulata IR180]
MSIDNREWDDKDTVGKLQSVISYQADGRGLIPKQKTVNIKS